MSKVGRLLMTAAGIVVFLCIVLATQPWSGQTHRVALVTPNWSLTQGVFLDVEYSPSGLDAERSPSLSLLRAHFADGRPVDEDDVGTLCPDSIVSVIAHGTEAGRGSGIPEVLGGCLDLSHPEDEYQGFRIHRFPVAQTVGEERQFGWLSADDEQGSHFWYPFDSLNVYFAVGVEYHLIHRVSSGAMALGETRIDSNVRSVRVPQSSGYEVKAELVSADEVFDTVPYWYSPQSPDQPVTHLVRIHVERPLAQRLVYAIVFLVMLSFLLLLSSVESVDSFIEGGVAFFLGVLTLRATVLPPTETRTVGDYAIWGLYFAFAGTVAAHVMTWIRELRSDKAVSAFRSTEDEHDPAVARLLDGHRSDEEAPKCGNATHNQPWRR